MSLLPWRTGIVSVLKKRWQYQALRVAVRDTHCFNFLPGQFVTLDLPIHEKPNKRWRSYSIASLPDET